MPCIFEGGSGKKRGINTKFLVLLPPVDPRFVQGTGPVCPRDKPRFCPETAEDKPGSNGGRNASYVKSLCALFAPKWFPTILSWACSNQRGQARCNLAKDVHCDISRRNFDTHCVHLLSKGLLQSEVLGDVCLWREAVRCKVFGEVEFSGVLCCDIQSRKRTSAKTSAQNIHCSALQNWRKFRKKTS